MALARMEIEFCAESIDFTHHLSSGAWLHCFALNFDYESPLKQAMRQ